MNRVFHHHDLWEDHQHGMYKLTAPNITTLTDKCRDLLSNPDDLHEAMNYVATFWSKAAEHNMSNSNRNRQAWLGQAACCFRCQAPEFVTKMAWRLLTDSERDAANAIADNVIEIWEMSYVGHGKQTALFS